MGNLDARNVLLTDVGRVGAQPSSFTTRPPPMLEQTQGVDKTTKKGEPPSLKQPLPKMKKCLHDDVDWESIADSLSRCQQSENPYSSPPQIVLTSTVTPILRRRPRELQPSSLVDSRSKTILNRRNAQNMPANMPKSTSLLPQSTPSPTAVTNPAPPPGLSTGAKAGIAGAAAIGIVVVLATLVTLHNRRRRRKYGYTRTKGKDGSIAELEGPFTVTTWQDGGEASPMILGGRQRSESEGEAYGFGIERPGGLVSPGLTVPGGNAPLMSNQEYNVSALSQTQYAASPQVPYSPHQPNLYSPPPHTYQPSPLLNSHRSSEPEPLSPDPYEQHHQRPRPSHPFSLLSEAIPPPKLEARASHSMADYQNAVPLGFANGFVQVGSRRGSEDSIQPTWELDLGDRTRVQPTDNDDGFNTAESSLLQAAEADNDRILRNSAHDQEGRAAVEDDEELPQYEELAPKVGESDGRKKIVRESVRWDQSTGHYHIDSDTDTDGEGEDAAAIGPSQRRTSMTKEELG